MGSEFSSHFIPGMIFLLLGCYWVVKTFIRGYGSLRKERSGFRSSCYIPVYGKFPADAYFVAFCSSIGALVGLVLPSDSVDVVRRSQHVAMAGFLGVLISLSLCLRKLPEVPKSQEYVLLAMSMVVPGYMFIYHNLSHDLTHNVQLIHTLLGYTYFGAAGSLLLEMTHLHNIIAALFRGYSFILIGLWLVSIALFFYPSSPFGGNEVMAVPVVFTWTALIGILILLFLGAMVRCRLHFGNVTGMVKEVRESREKMLGDYSVSNTKGYLNVPQYDC